MTDFVWLEFPATGGKQQFPTEAAPIWRIRGWQDCDPPPEPSLLKDPLLDDPDPDETPVPPVSTAPQVAAEGGDEGPESAGEGGSPAAAADRWGNAKQRVAYVPQIPDPVLDQPDAGDQTDPQES